MTTTTAIKSTAKTAQMEREPLKLLKRIGSTTYVVSVRFSVTSKETSEDKIHRLIESEVRHSA